MESPSSPKSQRSGRSLRSNSMVSVKRFVGLGGGKQAPGPETVRLELLREDNLTGRPDILGKVDRQPITGQIHIRMPKKPHSHGAEAAEEVPDFYLVDLWSRPSISGTVAELAQDKYLFRMMPMTYRSWMYHDLTTEASEHPSSNKELTANFDEHAIIKHALSLYCVDVPNARAGRQSPVMYWTPASFATAFMGDTQVLLGSLAMVMLLTITSLILNHPDGYKLVRPLTFPFRAAAIVYLMLRLQNSLETSVLAIVANSIAVLLALADLYFGDLEVLSYEKRICSYTVEKTLPNRIFLCRRHGDAVYNRLYTEYEIDQAITGMGKFSSDYALICEVRGLIMGLRPMEMDEWNKLLRAYMNDDSETPTYLALDVFNEDVPDERSLEKLAEEVKARRELMEHLNEIQGKSHEHVATGGRESLKDKEKKKASKGRSSKPHVKELS